MAKPGWNTVKEAQEFLNNAADLHPEAVVLQFTLNDAELNPYYLRPITPFAWESVLWRSHVFFSVVRYVNLRRHPYADFIRGLYDDSSDGWRMCRQSLYRIGQEALRRKAKPVLVIFPILEDAGDYPFADIHIKVRQMGEACGFTVVDLLPALQAAAPALKDFRVSRGDAHPNARAHAIAAGEIVKAVFAPKPETN